MLFGYASCCDRIAKRDKRATWASRTVTYQGKTLVRVEWWIDSSRLPDAVAWARLRIFDDRASDVRFEDSANIFAFKNEQYAEYFLSEDEYVCLSKLDGDDEVEYSISLDDLVPPASWVDDPSGEFKYLGIY